MACCELCVHLLCTTLQLGTKQIVEAHEGLQSDQLAFNHAAEVVLDDIAVYRVSYEMMMLCVTYDLWKLNHAIT